MEEISIVIPCYRGENTLQALVEEIVPLTKRQRGQGKTPWRVGEVILVFDGGSPELERLLVNLSDEHAFVKSVFLTRNFGQHAATIAGFAQTTLPWVATIDEDGQHNPAFLGDFVHVAVTNRRNLVYALPKNKANDGQFRVVTSFFAKMVGRILTGDARAQYFHSFRLVSGDIARALSPTLGPEVYLDVGLSWVTTAPGLAPVELRSNQERASSYSVSRLLAHFWSLFLSIGPRAMRAVSFIGIASAIVGLILAIVFLVQRISGAEIPEGWASQITVSLVFGGLILFTLGLISEYLSIAINAAMGKPTFVQSERRLND